MAFFKRSKQGSTSAATNDDTAKQSEQTAQSNAESDASKPEASSLWNRVRHGLKKTRDVLRTDIRDIFKSEGQLVDDEFLNRLFAILVKTDMGARPAAEIRDNIEAKFSGRVIEFEQALDEIRNHLKDILAQPPQPVHFAESGPTVILVVGVKRGSPGLGRRTGLRPLFVHRVAEGLLLTGRGPGGRLQTRGRRLGVVFEGLDPRAHLGQHPCRWGCLAAMACYP